MTPTQRKAVQDALIALGGLTAAIDAAGYSTEFQRNLSRADRAFFGLTAILEEPDTDDALCARRYRYLRTNSTRPVEPWSTHECPESLDDVVDAAIASTQEPK